jgi:Ser/Thr protein kinase RdoA (MazF antagonist)
MPAGWDGRADAAFIPTHRNLWMRRAVAAALRQARALDLCCGDEPECLADGANVLVHLRPAPVVARISTTTALVRRPAELWLARDLAMARFLVSQGFPAVAPSGELTAGPHLRDGFAISFWQFVEHERGYVASAEEIGPLLRELHEVLRGHEGKLERLSPFFELPGWLEEAEIHGALAADDTAMLRRAHAVVAAQIEKCGLPEQALHGDAHRKNLLKTVNGLLWTDFEDCCRGPILWDLACFARATVEGQLAALRAYGLDVREESLEPFLAARDLQGVVWMQVMATRFADHRSRAEEWLAAARSRYGRL